MGAGHDHGARRARAGEKHRGRLWAAVRAARRVHGRRGRRRLDHRLARPALRRRSHVHRRARHRRWRWPRSRAARRAAADPQRTFGLYRLEVLAALANAVLLFGVAVYVLVEAVRRLRRPAAEVPAGADADRGRSPAWSPTSSRSCCCAPAPRRASTSAAPTSRCSATCSARSASSWRRWSSRSPAGGGPTRWSPWRSACSSCRAPTQLGRAAVRILVQAAPEHLDVAAVARPAGRRARRLRRPRPARLDADLGHGRRLGAPEPGPAAPSSAAVLADGARRRCTTTSASTTRRCRSSRSRSRRTADRTAGEGLAPG